MPPLRAEVLCIDKREPLFGVSRIGKLEPSVML